MKLKIRKLNTFHKFTEPIGAEVKFEHLSETKFPVISVCLQWHATPTAEDDPESHLVFYSHYSSCTFDDQNWCGLEVMWLPDLYYAGYHSL
jgi:hypothetical protein